MSLLLKPALCHFHTSVHLVFSQFFSPLPSSSHLRFTHHNLSIKHTDMERLPKDTLLSIAHHISASNLRALALVSKQCVSIAQDILFRTPTLPRADSVFTTGDCINALIHALVKKPDLAKIVRSLDLRSQVRPIPLSLLVVSDSTPKTSTTTEATLVGLMLDKTVNLEHLTLDIVADQAGHLPTIDQTRIPPRPNRAPRPPTRMPLRPKPRSQLLHQPSKPPDPRISGLRPRMALAPAPFPQETHPRPSMPDAARSHAALQTHTQHTTRSRTNRHLHKRIHTK